MTSWGTVGLAEIIYTAAALPGLWFWFRNYLYARGTEKLTEKLPRNDGRSLWARFSTLLTRTFVGVESTFLFIGAYAMVMPESPNQTWNFGRIILVSALIAANAVIGLLGIRWKQVDNALTASAKRRMQPAKETE